MLIPIPFFGWFEDEEEDEKPLEKEQKNEDD
jgi:hypothetical protein